MKVNEKTKTSNGMAHQMEQSFLGTKGFSQVEFKVPCPMVVMLLNASYSNNS